MKKIKFIIVPVSLLLALNMIYCSKDSSIEPETTIAEELQEVLDEKLEIFNGTGVSAAVVFPDGDTWSGTSGVSFGTTAITPDMIFGIGSVTKVFIAALCLELAEEGTFSLDDSLFQWLPDYPNIDNSITILQLLNNTSGIYNITDNTEVWDAVFADPAKSWTPEEIISAFLPEPYENPGEGYYYSNTNYILLGKIINEATGSTVSTELRNRFFEPLGFNDTFFEFEEILPSNIAHGWFDLGGNGSIDDVSLISGTGIYSVLWAAGAIFSTAEDLAKWSSALFRGEVLSQSSLNQMLTSYATYPGTTDVGCGLGVFLIGPGNNAGVELVGYTGRTFGYLTSLFYVPDHGFSVAVMVNEDNVTCLDEITTALIIEVLSTM
ncbi:serine hydrolase domain-containing protein [candidate division KSB1 bacterium]